MFFPCMNSLKFPLQENGPLSEAHIRKRAAQREADNRKRAALYDPSTRPSQQRRLEHEVRHVQNGSRGSYRYEPVK